jgi:hypothetical protein
MIRRLVLAAAVAAAAVTTTAPAHALFCQRPLNVPECVGDHLGHPCIPAVQPYFTRTCL